MALQSAAAGDLFNVYSPWGIAWVMALFEGTVAFVMISAAMKSMDPSLEESARVLGAGKWRTMLTVTLPLVLPGVLGAAVFVFAEMLGSFAAAFVLGIPARFVVITTAIWQADDVSRPITAAPRRSASVAVRGDVSDAEPIAAVIWRGTSRPSPARRSARGDGDGPHGLGAVRAVPGSMSSSPWSCRSGVLLLTSFERFATVILPQAQFTLANYEAAFGFAAIAPALTNSLILGVGSPRSGWRSWRCWCGSSTARARPATVPIEYL